MCELIRNNLFFIIPISIILLLCIDRIDELEYREEINENVKICYQKMKGNFIISPRDFCYCNCVFDLKNGDAVICNYSVVHDSCPETKSIRGDILIFTYYRKISQNTTEINNLLHVYLKGSIGSLVYSKFASDQYDDFKNLNKELTKS